MFEDQSSISLLRKEEISTGILKLWSNKTITKIVNPTEIFTLDMIKEDAKGLKKISRGIKYNYVADGRGIKKASSDTEDYVLSEAYTNNFNIFVGIVDKKMPFWHDFTNFAMKILKKHYRNYPKYHFVSNKTEVLKWLDKMKNFPFVKILKKFDKTDFQVLRCYLEDKTNEDTSKEIGVNTRKVSRSKTKIFDLLNTRNKILLNDIINFSNASGKLQVEEFKFNTLDDLYSHYETITLPPDWDSYEDKE